MKLRRTMKAQNPKKKEIIIIKIKGRQPRIDQAKGHPARVSIRPKDMQQEEHQGPRTLMCPFEALRRGPWLTHLKTKMYIQISSKKPLRIQQNQVLSL